MPETVGRPQRKNESGGPDPGLPGQGPISFDLAFDQEAAGIKGYSSPVAGDADILLVPDFVAGNLLAKSLIYGGGARSAGFLMGASTPVILTSRSSSTEEKVLSIACSALAASNEAF